MKNSLIYLLLACFTISTVWAQDTRPTVAILDFEGQGISVQEVQTLTERMRSEIGTTNAVRLIERKAIESIMAEQGLAQSGCVSDECAAEVGQLLGVQFMVSGTIGKLGDSFTIDVKMFSVETGATERSVNATHEGDIAGLLTEMQILAWEIVGLQPPGRLKLKRGGGQNKSTVAILEAGNAADLHKNLKIPFSASSPGPQSPWTEDGNVGIDTSKRLGRAAPPISFALNCESVLVSAIVCDPPICYLIKLNSSYNFFECNTSSGSNEGQSNIVDRLGWFQVNISSEFIIINNIRSVICFITNN